MWGIRTRRSILTGCRHWWVFTLAKMPTKLCRHVFRNYFVLLRLAASETRVEDLNTQLGVDTYTLPLYTAHVKSIATMKSIAQIGRFSSPRDFYVSVRQFLRPARSVLLSVGCCPTSQALGVVPLPRSRTDGVVALHNDLSSAPKSLIRAEGMQSSRTEDDVWRRGQWTCRRLRSMLV
jgi:hypothetical protein